MTAPRRPSGLRLSGDAARAVPHLRGVAVEAGVRLPAPPAIADNFSAVPGWRAFDNHTLADCTCAAIGNAILQWAALTRAAAAIEDAEVTAAYRAIIATNPPGDDQALATPTQALTYWKRNRIGGVPLDDFARLGEPDDDLKDAIHCFGNAYLAIRLPATARDQQGAWDVVPDAPAADRAPGSWDNHAVIAVGYDPAGLTVVTWGETMRMSWAFWRAYAAEAFVLTSRAWTAHERAPAGVDYEALFHVLEQRREI